MRLSFATIRFFAVMLQTLKAPLLVRFPQKCVNLRNVKVSVFPLSRCFRFRIPYLPTSFRPSGVGFEQTAVGTTVDLSGASSSSGVADPDDSRRLSTGAVLAAVPS